MSSLKTFIPSPAPTAVPVPLQTLYEDTVVEVFLNFYKIYQQK